MRSTVPISTASTDCRSDRLGRMSAS
jgi:hypothetical protein